MADPLEDWGQGPKESRSEVEQTKQWPDEAKEVVSDQTPAPAKQQGGNKRFVMQIMALAGTLIVWMPFIFTLETSMMLTTSQDHLVFNYLMPAELFPIALTGCLMLVAVAQMARHLRKTIGLSFAAAIVLLFGGQIFTEESGLGHIMTQQADVTWIVTLNLVVGYSLAQLIIGVSGILLVKHVFRKK